MSYIKNVSIASLLLLLLYSCASETRKIYFYHWNTDFQLNASKQTMLEKLESEKMYVKFFDVTFSRDKNKPLPTATIQFKNEDITHLKELVPVVYITNEVFKKMRTPSEVTELSRNISDKIERLLKQKELKVTEIQFDCDWSMTTRENYFTFIKEFRKQQSYLNMGTPKISATIRLHQVKYKEKTGIPPVDSSVIMFYNVGELTSFEEENSILNLNTVDKYVSHLAEYPLEYDIALPLFSWAVIFNEGKFRRLCNDVDYLDVKKFHKEENYYRVKSGGMLGSDYYLYDNDMIRFETVDDESLSQLAKRIKKYAKQDFNVIYYHINSKVAFRYSAKEIQELSNKF